MQKITKILKEKKGASLLMVLALMLFLVIIAASTLTSALGATSSVQNQKEKVQIDLFAESLQMTLHTMLNETGTGNLQDELLTAVYAYRNNPALGIYDEVTISFEHDSKTYSFSCMLNTSDLAVSTNNIAGSLWVDAKINVEPTEDHPATTATYRIGYRLTSNAVIDSTLGTPTVATYGTWDLVGYEKIES